jgi:FG-GAP repeat protein
MLSTALRLSMLVLTASFSYASGINDLSAAAPAAPAARTDSPMPDDLRLAYYRSVATEMAARYQFPQENAVSLPSGGIRSLWATPAAWMEQKVTADDGQANDLFGFRVLVSGDTAFISAPAPIYRPGSLYVFKNMSGVWVETQKLVATPDFTPPPNWSDFFGWSLDLSGDKLIVGAPFTFGAQGPIGAAFVFTESGGVWTQTAELTASDAMASSYFGQSVGLARDTAVVGSYNRNGGEGAAYVFSNVEGAWSQTQLLVPSDGMAGDGHQFGTALAFNGALIIVGAPGPDYNSTGIYPVGAAYVFKSAAGVWSETQKLTATDGTPGDQFGFAVDISGQNALIGAPAANVAANLHQGSAYLFHGSNGVLMQSQKLTANDGAAYDQFGQSVALRGHFALIGEWSHDDDFTHSPPPPKQGTSYLFRNANGFWNQIRELSATDGEPGDSFGWDVALGGGGALIGAQGEVNGNLFQGAAYFYGRNNN